MSLHIFQKEAIDIEVQHMFSYTGVKYHQAPYFHLLQFMF